MTAGSVTKTGGRETITDESKALTNEGKVNPGTRKAMTVGCVTIADGCKALMLLHAINATRVLNPRSIKKTAP
jgi:hypothetical protein